MAERKHGGGFVLIMGMILVGASIVFTGFQYLFFARGAPTLPIFVVIAVGVATIITGASLAKRYLRFHRAWAV